MRQKIVRSKIVVPTACVILGLALAPARAASPSIVITNLPDFGTFGNLSGYVLNADPSTNSIAAYIFVAGNWYSKPNCASPLTTIHPDGSWTANITSVATDTNATEIAVFLVPTNYDQACVSGVNGLPIPPQAEAVVYANRVDPAARHFDFSDYGWSIKTAASLTGPGPNYFSNSTSNIWVDAQGALHLAITHVGNTWQCAEIISDRSFGYGQYRFTVSAPVNNLDPNVVFGAFTWSYDSAYNYREIDIELSRWAYTTGPSNVGDYAVAPFGTGQTKRFPLPVGVTNSTHSFIWQSNSIAFQSLNGPFSTTPAASNVLVNWNYTSATPPSGGEQVHLNLWLDNGNPPANNQPVEVVVTRFEFVPLGPPPAAQLSQPRRSPSGSNLFNLQVQPDWHYQILSSSNLLDWLGIGTILASNNSFQFTDGNPVSKTSCYYRVCTLP